MTPQELNEILTTFHKVLQKDCLEFAELKTLINNQNEQIEELKKSIILSTENANRSGRPPLSDEDITFIKQLRADGFSQRAVAEQLGVSNGVVAKYDKMLKNDVNEHKTENIVEKTADEPSLKQSNIFG